MRDQSGMWVHYCNVDHCWHGVGVAEQCAWCGRKEEDEPFHSFDSPVTAPISSYLQSRANDVG